MAQISASLVKELREMTGLAMMECKKALTEAGGDIKKAEQLLRIKSGARASKAAGRIAAEGAIGTYVSPDAKTGALVELNCETDFVAKNDDFLSFAQFIAQTAATRNPKDISQLAAGQIEERRQQLVQKIGENIAIRRFRRLQAAGKIALYIHGAKIGVLVDYEGPEEVGKDMGMHIAFARPRHLSKTEVPLEVINEERKIQEARARESGKPPEIAAKMVEGSLNKFLAEMSLMGQPFVKDDKQTVEKMLAARKAKINGFAFLVVGEGISKEKELH